jgi:hypothetical protein
MKIFWTDLNDAGMTDGSAAIARIPGCYAVAWNVADADALPETPRDLWAWAEDPTSAKGAEIFDSEREARRLLSQIEAQEF